MNKIMRCITKDGKFNAIAIDSGDMVHVMQEVHHTSPVATAALGRLLTAASIMGTQLKEAKASVMLKEEGGGPLGTLVAISDSNGNCRASVTNPEVELPLSANGKLDVGTAVGTNGLLVVIKKPPQGEPYLGQSRLVSGEIAEDITHYYATSEQIPTVCSLGVLVDKEDHKVLLAGGLLIQALPDADDAALERLEQNIKDLPSVTTMLAQGLSLKEICEKALSGFEIEVLDEYEVNYACNCSMDKVMQALASLPAQDLTEMARAEGNIEVKCEYCGHNYEVSPSDITFLAKKAQQKEAENQA